MCRFNNTLGGIYRFNQPRINPALLTSRNKYSSPTLANFRLARRKTALNIFQIPTFLTIPIIYTFVSFSKPAFPSNLYSKLSHSVEPDNLNASFSNRFIGALTNSFQHERTALIKLIINPYFVRNNTAQLSHALQFFEDKSLFDPRIFDA